MILSLIGVLANFLGSSTFASLLHFLLSEFGQSKSEDKWDEVADAAKQMLSGGLDLATTTSSIIADYNVTPAHAAIIASTTQRQLNAPAASTSAASQS